MSYVVDLKRAFYLAMPHAFGKDIWKDMESIEVLGRMFDSAENPDFSAAFSNVMDSVGDFFSGNVYCPSETARSCRKLGHLDSGLSRALCAFELGDFESRREAFLDADAGRLALEQTYRLGVEDVVFRANDSQVERVERDRAIRAGVHLVLLAHEDRARDLGLREEVLVANKLARIIAITEGMQADRLTRKDVYEALKTTADECGAESINTIAAALENEFSLQRQALPPSAPHPTV